LAEDSNVTTPPPGSFRAVDVFRSFEGVKALHGVSFDLRRDEVTGLIGPNGAGKTTLVNVMSGVDFPDSGTIELNGEDITSWTAEKRAAAGLARTFQHGHLFARLSARENVALGALGVGKRRSVADERAAELLERFGLTRYADREARSLPHGEASKLGVARALAADPSFVLMDEPAAGLSEPEVPAFVGTVRSICRDHHVGVLIIDHNIELIMELCDRVVVLDNGSVLTRGLPAEVRADPSVAAAYLGSVGSAN
jgi:ABC-type branched-subunit amino acid transport system ATPase component